MSNTERQRKPHHGMRYTRPYRIWCGMKERCQRVNHPRYADYGGRGIVVCPEWQTFEGFWADMSAGYDDNLSLDRRDHNGPYCKGNCRWATQVTQQRNRRDNCLMETPWGVITIAEAAQRAGMGYHLVYKRRARGWPMERIFAA